MSKKTKREWYRKSHSFRLTHDDFHLYRYLENYKGTKSERIREMLLFALKYEPIIKNGKLDAEIQVEDYIETSENNEKLLEKLNELEKIIKSNHDELMKKTFEVSESKEDEEDEMDESIENTNNALFESWGVEF